MLPFVATSSNHGKKGGGGGDRQTSQHSASVSSTTLASGHLAKHKLSIIASVRVAAPSRLAPPLHTNMACSGRWSPVIMHFVIIRGLDV